MMPIFSVPVLSSVFFLGLGWVLSPDWAFAKISQDKSSCRGFVDKFLKDRNWGGYGKCVSRFGSCSFKEDAETKTPKVQLIEKADSGISIIGKSKKSPAGEPVTWVFTFERTGDLLVSEAFEPKKSSSTKAKKPTESKSENSKKKKLTLEERFAAPPTYERTYVFSVESDKCTLTQLKVSYHSPKRQLFEDYVADPAECLRLVQDYDKVKEDQRKLKKAKKVTGHLQMARPKKDKNLLYLGQFCWESRDHLAQLPH